MVRVAPALAVPLAALLALAGAACQPEAADRQAAAADDGPPAVEVTARDFAFEAPDTIPPGWTTLRMENVGAQEHFLVLWRLPDGKGLEDYAAEVGAPFDSIMGPYRAGAWDRERALATLAELLPGWYGDVEPASGVGLTDPGRTGETTVRLRPGTYVMECYVKTPEGQFHQALGMLRELTVAGTPREASPPEADVRMTLSNYRIDVEGAPGAGEQVVRVVAAEDPEGLLTHDVHLARTDTAVSVDSVVAWMDWMDALEAPSAATFVGGAEQMSAGDTAYVRVDLSPGEYAWISEAYGGRGMVEAFTVE